MAFGRAEARFARAVYGTAEAVPLQIQHLFYPGSGGLLCGPVAQALFLQIQYLFYSGQGGLLCGALRWWVGGLGMWKASSFKAIGACEYVKLGWFDWEEKKYKTAVELKEQVELLSMIGDVALKDDEPQVHAH